MRENLSLVCANERVLPAKRCQFDYFTRAKNQVFPMKLIGRDQKITLQEK